MRQLNADDLGEKLVENLRRRLQNIPATEDERSGEEVGMVGEVGDGVVRIYGLNHARSGERLEFASGVSGLALSLEEVTVGAVLLGGRESVRQGEVVRSTGQGVMVPVGQGLLGRVVDALGRPLDGKGPIVPDSYRSAEGPAPGVTARFPVHRPLETGIKAIDAMIPIGRGQRELIIGDRGTGKSALAIDALLNQSGGGVLGIYAAIGQKASSVAKLVALLEERGVMQQSVIVAATAGEPASLQYLAPFSACAIAEHFMYQGRDALVVYDDLSKHAIAYRSMSLLLRRPPGREAFPGDVFYLHARLLERAAQLDEALGGGSLTALPIVETLAGDVSAYIPTNIISITDGQIYLDSDLFYSGIRPAVNVGLSISRVGGAAQSPVMKKVAGRMRLELAQFRELASFARFGAEVDRTTRERLERGRRLTELMKQPQHRPVPAGRQIAAIFAVTAGLADKIPADEIPDFEKRLLTRLDAERPEVFSALVSESHIPAQAEQGIRQAARDILAVWEAVDGSEADGNNVDIRLSGAGQAGENEARHESRGDSNGLIGGA